MRTINVEEITKNIKEMCIEANHFLSDDMDKALKNATETEKSPLGKQILNQLQENLKIAGEDMIPICQDTGMAVVFLEVGQDVHFEGGLLEDAVNEGIRQGYVEGYLSKIPVQILKAFDSENWKIIITNEELKEKFGFTYDIYGVTDYDTKTIYTYASEDAIQYGLGHEIGHFVDMYMGDLSQTLEWNKLVKTINPQYTPAYYFTLGNNENKGLEYFADSFLLYINDKLLLTKCSLEVSKFWNRLFDYLDDILKVISENTIKTNIFTSPSNYWNLSD